MSGAGIVEVPLLITGGAVVLAGAAVATGVMGLLEGIGSIASTGKDIYEEYDERSRRRKISQENNRRAQEYRKLNEKLNQNQKKIRKEIQKQNLQTQEILKKKIDAVKKQQKLALDKAIKSFDERIKYTEEKFDDRIDNLAIEVDKQFSSQRKEFKQCLTEQKKIFNAALKKQGKDLQNQIDVFAQKVENAKKSSEDWIGLAEVEINFIRKNYDYEFFFPGELEPINNRCKMATDNFNQGNYEAALAVSQESFMQAAILRQKLERNIIEWEAFRSLCLEQLDLINISMERLKTFKLEELEIQEDGKQIRHETDIEVDTDYWLKGEFSKLKELVDERIKKLESPKPAYSIDQLKALHEESVSDFNRIPILLSKAKIAVIAFNLRAEIQNKFAEKLSESGYTLVDNVCEGDDQRKANHLILRGPSAEKLCITLKPDENNGELASLVEINFRDDTANRKEREEKVNLLMGELSKAYDIPLDVLKYKCKEGTNWHSNADEEKFDPEKLRQKG